MGIYKRQWSDYYWSRITLNGRTVQESTRTADRREAQEWTTGADPNCGDSYFQNGKLVAFN